MADPNWNNGFYYDSLPPHTGMKLARRGYLCPFSWYLSDFKPDRNCNYYLPFGTGMGPAFRSPAP